MDRAYSAVATVYLAKGRNQLTVLDAGGGTIGSDKGVAVEWKDNAVQFKGRNNDNVLTCFAIGFAW